MTQKTCKVGWASWGCTTRSIQLASTAAKRPHHRGRGDGLHPQRGGAGLHPTGRAERPLPAFDPTVNHYPARRNAALTSIQPTGTVSMIADCASGCEPYFSIVMVKNVMDGDRLLMINKHFERVARAVRASSRPR